MADSTAILEQLQSNAAGRDVVADGLFDAASHAATFGRKQSETFSLQWTVYGGRWAGMSVTTTTVTLTASRTNFIVVHRTTGAISCSAEGSNWVNVATYARLFKVVCDALGISTWTDWRFGRGGVFPCALDPNGASGRFEVPVPAFSDITSAIAAGTRKAVISLPFPALLTDIRGRLATAGGSGSNPTFDVNDEGTSILGTKLSIDAFEKTSVTAATPFTFAEEGAQLAADAEISIDIDDAGSGAKGPVIWLIGERGWGDPGVDLNVSMLSLEGANGGTTWTDAVAGRTWTRGSSTTTSTAASVNSVLSNYAASSTYFGTSNQFLQSDTSADFDPGTAPWCLDFWFLANSTASFPHFFELGASATNRLSLLLGSGALSFYTQTDGGNGAQRIGGASISTGTWYHVRVSFDLTTYRLFLDGASQGTSTTSVKPSGSSRITLGNQYLGGSPSSSTALDGYMQRFRFTRHWARTTSAFTRPGKPFKTY